MTNTEAEVDIDTINDAHISVLIPVMVLFGCISILGACGNSLVCYVYGCKLPKNTQSYLIVQLAAIDLLSSIIGIPSEIIDMRYHLNYTMPTVVCKVTKTLMVFFILVSDATLIAIDRYRKICTPFKGQMKPDYLRKVTCLTVVVGLLIA